jgi:hypothetical protein
VRVSSVFEEYFKGGGCKKDLRKMRTGGWRGMARRRDEWKSVLREVKVLQGP